MKLIPPTVLIQDTDFGNAWARAVRYVIREGVSLVIGDATEPKPIRDICATIEMTGDAIQQIENRELHPQFPFQHIAPYCEEFTREYLSQYIEKSDRERFSYLYFKRLVMYGDERMLPFDQIKFLRQQLAFQIHDNVSSNRDQAVTWQALDDLGSTSPPCLQKLWIRYLGDLSVEVHLTWRSRDLYIAWQANIIALVDMLNREVIHPNKCEIVKIVDFSDSLHIYRGDEIAARDVKLVPTLPMPR